MALVCSGQCVNLAHKQHWSPRLSNTGTMKYKVWFLEGSSEIDAGKEPCGQQKTQGRNNMNSASRISPQELSARIYGTHQDFNEDRVSFSQIHCCSGTNCQAGCWSSQLWFYGQFYRRLGS